MAINAGGIEAYLDLNTAKFDQKLKSAQTSMDKFGNKMKSLSDKAGSLGKKMTAGLTLPIAGLGAMAIKVGAEFEKGMSQVMAISGATGQEMKELETLARDMGATTKFSASEAAEGLKFMAMAGWDAAQMTKALPAVLDLAAASGEDLGMVSDIVTDSLTAFGLGAEDAIKFTDLLANTATNSNTNVALMGETFKYVAPLFGSLGYKAEDAALATGLMANAGIKGGQAGTALRASITNLIEPTKDGAVWMEQLGISMTDADGNMKPFDETMGQLRESFKDLTEEQQAQAASQLFGKEAMSGMLAIINTSEEDYNKLTKATTDYNGAAKEMADIMGDNLEGKMVRIKSALSEAALKIYEAMLPALNKLADVVQKAIDWFLSLSDTTIRIITIIAGLVAAIGPLLLVFSTLLKVFGPLIKLFKTVGAGIALIGTKSAIAAALAGKFAAVAKVITLLMNPWAIGIAAVVAGIVLLVKHLKKDAIPEIDRFGEEVSDSTQESVGAFMNLNENANKELKEMVWGQKVVTTEMATDMKEKQQQITENLLSELNKRQEEEKKLTINQFAELDSISEERKQELIEAQDRFYEEQKTLTQSRHDEINAIITDAEANGRKITEEEAKKIELIREEMVVTAVKTLSESEVEQKAILERMASNSSALSAREAADVVKNSKEKKDAVVDEANKQYVETKEWARQQYEDVGELSEEEYKQVLANAEATRDGKVTNAEDSHNEVVRHAKEQAGEHVDAVDWETGEVMTKWEQMTKGMREQDEKIREVQTAGWNYLKEFIPKKAGEIKDSVVGWFTKMDEGLKVGQEALKEFLKKAWQTMYDNTIGKAIEMKDSVVLKFTELKDQSIERLNQLKDDAIALPGKIADGIRRGADAVKRAFVEMWNSVVRGISGPVNMVIKGANWILDNFGADQISLWEPTYYGKGTDGHLGGPAIINDQKGSTYREAVMMPDGHTFIPEGRNLLFPNMPKGTKVLPARETKGIYNYAGGVGEWFKDKYNTGKEVVGNVMDKAKDIFSYMTDPGKLIGEVLGSFVDLSGTSGIVTTMAGGMINKIKDSMVEWAKGLFDKYGAVMGGGIGFGGWPITSPFGWRIHPISGERSFHSGVDFGAPYGAPVAAQHAGTVNHSGWMGGYGIAVKIAQGITEQLYAHLSQAIVSVGQSVAQGQIIGNIGSTGNSTGPHLHYEMRRNGSPVNPGFTIGSRYVPRDMVANLHKGEMVVPKNENPYKNSKGKILPDDNVRQPLVIQVMMEDGRILAENIVDDINQLLGNKNNLSARGLA